MSEIESTNLETVDSLESADALLEQIESPSNGPINDTPQATPQVDEFDLTVGGKQIKAKRDQLIQWAQQGYTAPGKISSLTKEIETWKSKYSADEQKWKGIESKYSEIDGFVQKNPQFWDHVIKNWEQRQNLLNDTANPANQVLSDLQSQVQDLIQYKNQVENERQKNQMTQEDQAYMSTLEETKKTYPDIDFDAPNEEGYSLEYQILKHAQENGIKNFKTAFRDYCHDELTKRAADKAKEELTKNRVKNTKLGILGITPAPAKKASTDVRGKSYDNLAQEALAELGIT